MRENLVHEDFIKKLCRVAIIFAIALATMTPFIATTASAGDDKPPIPREEQKIAVPNVSWNCCKQ